jgi:hypothetical protein
LWLKFLGKMIVEDEGELEVVGPRKNEVRRVPQDPPESRAPSSFPSENQSSGKSHSGNKESTRVEQIPIDENKVEESSMEETKIVDSIPDESEEANNEKEDGVPVPATSATPVPKGVLKPRNMFKTWFGTGPLPSPGKRQLSDDFENKGEKKRALVERETLAVQPDSSVTRLVERAMVAVVHDEAKKRRRAALKRKNEESSKKKKKEAEKFQVWNQTMVETQNRATSASSMSGED